MSGRIKVNSLFKRSVNVSPTHRSESKYSQQLSNSPRHYQPQNYNKELDPQFVRFRAENLISGNQMIIHTDVKEVEEITRAVKGHGRYKSSSNVEHVYIK